MPNYRITARAAVSPVTLERAVDHLQLYGDVSYNDYVTALLQVATEVASGIIGEPIESYTVQAWGQRLERFEFPHQSIRTVTTLQYYNVANVLTTVSPATYFLDLNVRYPEIRFTNGTTPPGDFSNERENPVLITYEAGLDGEYGQDIEHAVLLIVGDLFHSRSSTSDKVSNKAYITAETLLNRYRRAQW